MKLHVGCGTNKLEGWVNIDAVPDCAPDLVHNLSLPLPYPDLSVDELKAEGVLEHFDKMRLTGTEEPGHPHAHHVATRAPTPQRLADQRERVDYSLQLVFNFVGDNILAHLAGERGSVEDLDDAFNPHPDVALDDVPYGGHSARLLACVAWPLIDRTA